MSSADDEGRWVELETRLAFQEHTLDALNQALVRQQQQLAELETLCRYLLAQLREVQAGAGGRSPADEKPPHY